MIYDGNTTTLVNDDFYTSVSTGGAAGISEVTLAGAGAMGVNRYLDITMTATNSYAAAVVGFCGAATNVSSYSSGALVLYFQIPGTSALDGGGCNNFRPMVRLVSNSLAPNNESLAITATAYLTYTAGTFVAGAWSEVVIPMSAFVGANDSGGSFGTAADFNALKGVEILPWRDSYNSSAGYNGEVYVGNISFSNSNVPVARVFSGLFADFEENNGKAVSNWVTSGGQSYWAVFTDSYTACTPDTTVSFPTGYPTDNSPLDIAATGTGCMGAHLQGYKGAADSTTPCGGFASMGMTCKLNPVTYTSTTGGACDLSNNNFLVTLPAGGATGLIFSLKLGPLDTGGVQSYRIFLKRLSETVSGDDYCVQIADTSLTSTYTQFQIPFPADGTPSVLHPSATLTDLNWAQPSTAKAPGLIPWGRTDFYEFEIDPVTRGVLGQPNGAPVDIYVDDISFY